MSQLIENPKTYAGRELENIFFRPLLTGPDAIDLGIKVMYNMPVPTTLNFWRRSGDILQKYGTGGWSGGTAASKYQKTIDMQKVKAEIGYSASDYFSMVYEQITGRSDVNLDDLSGTELEQAETELFRQAIAESIRATMWLGSTERANGTLATFDGLLKSIHADRSRMAQFSYTAEEFEQAGFAENLLRDVLANAPEELRALKSEGNLALAVNTSDFPGTEVRMWYNPDQMENRQRAVFMAGCDYLLPELISYAYIA